MPEAWPNKAERLPHPSVLTAMIEAFARPATLSRQAGFTLIELLVVVVVAVLGLALGLVVPRAARWAARR